MKNGKLEQSDVGKKFTKSNWGKVRFFVLLAFTSKGVCLGECNWGLPIHESNDDEDWLEFEYWIPLQERIGIK